jgi:hypothetical protein
MRIEKMISLAIEFWNSKYNNYWMKIGIKSCGRQPSSSRWTIYRALTLCGNNSQEASVEITMLSASTFALSMT